MSAPKFVPNLVVTYAAGHEHEALELAWALRSEQPSLVPAILELDEDPNIRVAGPLVVVLATDDYAAWPAHAEELYEAGTRNEKFYPVVLNDAEATIPLAFRAWEFFAWPRELRELADLLAARLPGPTATPDRPTAVAPAPLGSLKKF